MGFLITHVSGLNKVISELLRTTGDAPMSPVPLPQTRKEIPPDQSHLQAFLLPTSHILNNINTCWSFAGRPGYSMMTWFYRSVDKEW